MAGSRSDQAPSAARRGMRTTINNNVAAFGFSLLATCSFGAISHFQGAPGIAEVILFAVGGIAAFTAIETVLSNFFRRPLEDEPSRVIALGAAFSFISVGLGVGGAALQASIVDGGVAWPLGGLVAVAIYIGFSGLEMGLAERLEERRED